MFTERDHRGQAYECAHCYRTVWPDGPSGWLCPGDDEPHDARPDALLPFP